MNKIMTHIPKRHVATTTLPGQDGLIGLFGVKLNGIVVRMVVGGHIARLVIPYDVFRAISNGHAAELGGDQRNLQYFFRQQVKRRRRHLLCQCRCQRCDDDGHQQQRQTGRPDHHHFLFLSQWMVIAALVGQCPVSPVRNIYGTGTANLERARGGANELRTSDYCSGKEMSPWDDS